MGEAAEDGRRARVSRRAVALAVAMLACLGALALAARTWQRARGALRAMAGEADR